MIPVSNRLDKVHSDIRGPLYQEALRMEAQGEEILKLNTGNPGRFDFAMPDSVRSALMEQLDEAVPYCDVRGMLPARQAIRDYHLRCGIPNVQVDDIFICNGVSEAASMLTSALVGYGEELLVPTPCYSLWSNNAYLNGATPVFYRCDPDNGWNPDLADIRSKISPKTRAILIINPNNPTGAVYSDQVLLGIAAIARETGIAVISDEIYDRLALDGRPVHAFAALAPDVPCVTMNGLSKSHIVCGFRCGWMTFSGDREGQWVQVKQGVMKLAAMRLCGNALTQLVIPAALADAASTQAMLIPGGRLYEQRKAVCDVLDEIDGVSYCANQAAFYLFPGIDRSKFDFADDQDFAMQFLHEEHVLVIPGRGFDWQEDLRFRIVMLPEPDVLRSAMYKLKAFLDRHRIA